MIYKGWFTLATEATEAESETKGSKCSSKIDTTEVEAAFSLSFLIGLFLLQMLPIRLPCFHWILSEGSGIGRKRTLVSLPILFP